MIFVLLLFALLVACGGGGGAGPQAILVVEPTVLNFGDLVDELPFWVENAGDADLEWQAQVSVQWVQILPTQGVVAAGATQEVRVRIFREGLPAGPNGALITIQSNAGSLQIQVIVFIPGDTPPPAPASLQASDGTQADAVVIQWSPVPEAQRYRLERRPADGGSFLLLAEIQVTEWRDEGAIPGKDYVYRVRALAGPLESDPVEDIGWRALPPITGVQASDGSFPDRVVIQWDTVPGVAGHRVERAEGGGPFLPLAEVLDSPYEDRTATPGVLYSYRVIPLGPDHEGSPSAADTGYAGTLQVPPAPSGLQASDGVGDYIDLTWSPVATADSYTVWRAEQEEGPYTILVQGLTDTQYRDHDVQAGQWYWYRVQAVNAFGGGPLSPPEAGYSAGAPPPPLGLMASQGAFVERVELEWEPVPGADGYRVLRANQMGGPFSEIATVNQPGYTDYPPDWSTYWYQVTALRGATESVPAGPVAGWRAPAPPGNLRASQGAYTVGILLQWDAVPQAEAYRVERAESAGGPFSVIGETEQSSWMDGTARPGRDYWYRVRTRIGDHLSPPSAVVSGWRALEAPAVQATEDREDGVLLTWGPVDGAEEYRVSRAESENGPYQEIARTSDTQYLDTGLTPGRWYWYRVASGAQGRWSEEQTVSGLRALSAPQAQATQGSRLDGVLLSWSAVEGAVRYCVERAEGQNFVRITETADTQYLDSGTEPGKDYRYRVCGIGQDVEGPFSGEVTGWRALGVPQAQASEGRTDGVLVSWTSVAGAQEYIVERAQEENGAYQEIARTADTQYLDTSAVEGLLYWYRVRARAYDHASAPSAPDAGYRGLGPPTWVEASDGTSAQAIVVQWEEVAGAGSYIVERAEAPDGAFQQVATVAGPPYEDAVTPGKDYWYRVRAQAGLSTSGPSPADVGWRALEMPTAQATQGQEPLVVQWNAVEGAQAYRLLRGETPDALTPIAEVADLSYTDADAVPGKDYWYAVQALGEDHEGPLSTAVLGWRALTTPSDLQASQGQEDGVHLQWTATGAPLYRLLRADSVDGNFQVIGETAGPPFLDGQAVPGKDYWYRVQPVGEDHEGAPSDAVQGWRGLAVPTVQASDGQMGGVQIQWDAVAGALRYRVEREDPDNPGPTLLGEVTDTQFLDDTVVAGKDFRYLVTPVGEDHEGMPGSDIGWRGLATPQNLQASDGTDTAVVALQWQDSGAPLYRVYRAESPTGTETLLAETAATNYDDASAVPGKDYWYRVRSAGEDHESDAAEDTGWRGLGVPQNVQASDGTDESQVLVQWDAIPDVPSYRVYRAETADGTYTLIGETSQNSFGDTQALPGKDYWYRVTAKGEDHEGDPSASDSGWRAIPAPQGFQASDGTDTGAVLLSWNPISDISTYRLYRAEQAGGPFNLLAEVQGTSYSDSTATPGKDYWYRVTGQGEDHEGPPAEDTGWRGLGVPQNVQASDGAFGDRVEVQWDALPDVATYGVYRAEASGGPFTHLADVGAPPYQDTSAAPGKDYWYRVTAKGPDHEGDPSASDVGWRALAVPQNLQASDGTFTDRVQLQWDPINGATFRVYRAPDPNGNFTALATTTQNSYDDASAVPGKDYWYRVTVVGEDHEGDPSNTDSGWRGLGVPQNVQASDGTFSDRVRLNWDPVSGAQEYRVYRATDPGGPFNFLASTTNTTYDDTTVTAGVTYWYYVTAFRNDHESDPSNTDSGYAGEPSVLADSPWPKHRADLRNSGTTDFTGPTSVSAAPPRFAAEAPIVSSPALDGRGYVVVGSLDFRVYALQPISSGFSVVWDFYTGDFVTASPTIGDGDEVYIGSQNGTFYRLSPTGATVWAVDTGAAIESTATLTDTLVVFGNNDGIVYALQRATGAQQWTYTLGGEIHGPLAYFNQRIFVASTNGDLVALKLDGTEDWKVNLGAPILGGPAVDGTRQRLYIGTDDGTLYALRLSDGSEAWRYTPPPPDDAPIVASPAVDANGNVYFANWAGKLYKLDPQGNFLWSFSAEDMIESSVAVDNQGHIYFGSWDRKVYALDSSGNLLWSFQTGDIITLSSPALGNHQTQPAVFIGSYDNNLWALIP